MIAFVFIYNVSIYIISRKNIINLLRMTKQRYNLKKVRILQVI